MAEFVEPNLLSTETINFDDDMSNFVDTTSNTTLETSIFQMGFPPETEEIITEMIEKERQHSPRDDYLKRLRDGDLDLNVRNQALDWIWKVRFLFIFSSVDSILTKVNNLMTLI